MASGNPSISPLATRALKAAALCPELTTPPQFVDMPEMAPVSEDLDPREVVALWAGHLANVVMDRVKDLNDALVRAHMENIFISAALDLAHRGKPLETKAVTIAAHSLWLAMFGDGGEA